MFLTLTFNVRRFLKLCFYTYLSIKGDNNTEHFRQPLPKLTAKTPYTNKQTTKDNTKQSFQSCCIVWTSGSQLGVLNTLHTPRCCVAYPLGYAKL